jgi:hypothetical protein
MSYRAWLFLWIVFMLGLAYGGWGIVAPPPTSHQWITFAVFVLLATGSQFWEAEAPGRQSYYPHFVFFAAGVLVLPAALFNLLVIIPHIAEWAKKRWEDSPRLRQWYIQPFNMATHMLAGAAAQWVHSSLSALPNFTAPPWSILAVGLAVLTYVISNHLLIGQALVLTRGLSWQESGVLDRENLLTDWILMLLGRIANVV